MFLEKTFGNKDKLDKTEFANMIDTTCSEVFIYILLYLLESRPFTNKSIQLNVKPGGHNTPVINKRFIASPSLKTNFSPSTFLKKFSTEKLQSSSRLSKLIGSKNSK